MGEEKEQSFEEAMEELEGLISTMESGNLSIEESLTAYERGVKLTKHCKQILENAQQRVTQLMPDGSQEALN